ncbi:hypothetical protein [Nonomuraea sp. NPDC049695]|uniref:hypothetical protein n=1 Tax=Nonomuraea sp. NPDC049695 TaxID=3154734 RepID=UPI0034296B95
MSKHGMLAQVVLASLLLQVLGPVLPMFSQVLPYRYFALRGTGDLVTRVRHRARPGGRRAQWACRTARGGAVRRATVGGGPGGGWAGGRRVAPGRGAGARRR